MKQDWSQEKQEQKNFSRKDRWSSTFTHTKNGEMTTFKAECKDKLTHGNLWVWHHATLLFQWDLTAFSCLREIYFQLQVLCSKTLECAEKKYIWTNAISELWCHSCIVSCIYIYLFVYGIVDKKTVLVLRN